MTIDFLKAMVINDNRFLKAMVINDNQFFKGNGYK